MNVALFQQPEVPPPTARCLEHAFIGLQALVTGACAIVERFNTAEQSEELDAAVRILEDLERLMLDFYAEIVPTVARGKVDRAGDDS